MGTTKIKELAEKDGSVKKKKKKAEKYYGGNERILYWKFKK